MKIGFIGLGNMGSAIATAVAKLEKHDFLLSNHNPEKAASLQDVIGGQLMTNADIASQAEVIFLGVKPHLIGKALTDLADAIAVNPQAIWISMVAGLTLADLQEYLPADNLIRIMPNTPVAIGQGMTTYAVENPQLAPLVEDLLAASGVVAQVPEDQIDAATAIAGCGPAFVYVFIDALMQAGLQNGLSADLAKKLAAQTLLGSAQLVLESGIHPAQLRDQVTSPGGSTIAGLVALEEHNFRYATLSGVNQALAKTRTLGKK
ncbi:pyrroline-5-carboxylate reductase [Streptococcus gallinaceus]|uniref:pyrroline-5-carboxylate reductase n=1 Tax=Streptococcus gallinaceus TaxID=165758 RepID=UPI0020A16D8F|nr:pyrroline-5-carboxylate reductase [Streptococcus gallinaceus]MCP1639024.1 pyrroline-5-carboxylate reductase [Streptococcus gallinaceus]MCP1769732.1 pyrroline-5-carboxylate reductase [Streptococcus gallinaceus]